MSARSQWDNDIRSKAATPQLDVSDPIFNQARAKDSIGLNDTDPLRPSTWQAKWNFQDHIINGYSNFDFSNPRDRACTYEE